MPEEVAVFQRDMTPEEMQAHLREPLIATIATVKRDGSPQLTPVWFEYREPRLLIQASDPSVKVHNLRRDPRVTVSIAAPTPAYRYVVFYGHAKISTQDVQKTSESIFCRYIGQEAGLQLAKDILSATNAVIIEVTPTKVLSWTAKF